MAAPFFETSWLSHRHSAGGNHTALAKYVSIVKASRFPNSTKSFPSRNAGRGVRITLPSPAAGRLESINKVNTTDGWCCATAARLIHNGSENSTSDTDRRTNVFTGCARRHTSCSDASTSGEKVSRTLPGESFKLGHHRSRILRSWSEKPTESSGCVHLSSMYYINKKNLLENDAVSSSSLPNISRGKPADVRLRRHLLNRERHSTRAGQHSRQSAPPVLVKPTARPKVIYTGDDITDLSFWKRKRPFSQPEEQPVSLPVATLTKTTPKSRDRDSSQGPPKRLYTFIHFSAIRPGAISRECQTDDYNVTRQSNRESESSPTRQVSGSRDTERDVRVDSGKVTPSVNRPLSRRVPVRSAVSRLSSCVSALGFRNPPPSLASAVFNDDTGGEHDDYGLWAGDGNRDVNSPIPRGMSTHPNSACTGRNFNTILEADRDPAGDVGDATRGQ